MSWLFVGCAASLVAAGCAQLAGIDDTDGSARAGDTVVLTRVSFGATLMSSPLDLTGLQANYLVQNAAAASGVDRVAAAGGGGTWTTLLRAPAPVELTLPDLPSPVMRVYDFPSNKLTVPFGVYEHPGRTPPPDPATIALAVMLDTAYTVSDHFLVYTLGSWTQREFAPSELDTSVAMRVAASYMFSSSSSLSGRAGLDRLTSQDAFLILRYAGAVLTGAAVAPPFDQTSDDSVMATMSAVTQDRTLDVKASPATLASRFTAVRPAVSTLVMNWSLVAAPGYRFAHTTGPQLNAGSLTASDAGVSFKYGNPFVDREWNTIFTLATQETRTYTPTGTTTPVTLYAGMNQFIEPSTTGTDTLRLDAALPLAISLDGTRLSNDGEVIAPPTRFVSVTLFTEHTNNTLYALQIYDLLPNMAGTALEYHFVFEALSKEPAFTVPPEIFQTGHRYTMRASSIAGGYPAAATGDLSMRQLPMAQSFADSAVFTVMP